MFVNWVLAPLNLADADGGKVKYYRLFLDGGWGVGDFIGWVTANILYLPVVIPTAYAAKLLAFVVDPSVWLRPIQQAWTAVTTKLFSFVSPFALLAVALLAAVVMVVVRSRSSTDMLHSIAARISGSVMMGLLIAGLLYNPAGTLLSVLTVWVRLVSGVFGDAPSVDQAAGTPGSTPGAGSVVLTQFLRPLTWMLNYGSQLSPECGKAWAKMIETGGELTCLDPSQVQASKSVGIAFIMTVAAIIPVWIYLRFVLVVTITFVTHVALALARFAAAGAAAAVAVRQERPGDEFMRFLLAAVANLVVASAIIGAAVCGPDIAVIAAGSLTKSTLVHFAALTLAYYLLSRLMWWLEARHGPIRDWLAGSAQSAKRPGVWALAFPGGLKPQTTALDRLIAGMRASGSQWAEQAREQVKKMVHNEQDTVGPGGVGGALDPRLIPDTPESVAAWAVVNTTSPTASHDAAPAAASIAQSVLTRLKPLPAIADAPVHNAQGRQAPPSDASPQGNSSPAHATDSWPPPDRAPVVIGAPAHELVATPAVDLVPSAQPVGSSWRERLRRETLGLAAVAADPEAMSLAAVRINSAIPAQLSTLNDARGNATGPLDPRAPLSAYLARITYLEIVLRALGLDTVFDAAAVLPAHARFFTSGIDESGNWTTTFYGR